MQDYIKTDQLLHSLSQFIAKMNRQFLVKKQDDSHTNLCFDPLQGALLSHWLDTKNGPLLFRLNLVDWSFDYMDKNFKLLHRIDLQNTKLSDLDDYINYALQVLGINSEGFSEKMHYQIPEYKHADDCLKTTHPLDLEEWMAFRSLANNACYQILGSIQKEGEVRIWPHHFDTGIYLKLKDNVYLSFGIAMQDDYCKAPYFYASAYDGAGKSLSANTELHPLIVGEEINTNDFKSMILSLKDIKDSQEDLLKSYIRSFLKIYLRLL